MKQNEHGRSMIEMLGVLAIVGVLSVGGIAGYSKAMQKYKTNQLIAQLSETIIGIRSLYASRTSYAGINLPLLFTTGAIPHILQRTTGSTSSAVHALNGDLFIFASPSSSLATGAFEIYITDIPSTTCLMLATMDWGQDVASGFIGFYIGAGYIDTPQMASVVGKSDSNPENGIYTSGFHEDSIPLSIPAATQACQCEGLSCTIGFKYQ